MKAELAPIPRKNFLGPAFEWALMHAPLIFLLFYGSLNLAVGRVPASYRPWLWVCGAVEAIFLGGLLFILTAPLAKIRVYPWLAPVVMGLVTVFFGIDALIHRSVGFHFNSFFLRVALQPNAFQETGISNAEVFTYLGLGLGFLILEGILGFLWIQKIRGNKYTFAWKWLILILVFEVVDRLTIATFAFMGGDSIRQAGQVLPLQASIRMNKLLGKIVGDTSLPNLAVLAEEAGIPEGNLSPEQIQFQRKPDILMILVESTRYSSFWNAQTMPNLYQRSREGMVFERHYSSASSTHYALFSLFYGLPATELETVVGAGRTSLLFPALKKNGYQIKLMTASSVDWMDLTNSVFKDVQADLITDFTGDGYERDNAMMARARQFVEQADKNDPLFLFLFFVGTHFRYSYPPSAEKWTPCWDGKSSTAATTAKPVEVERRARNAAWEVDRKVEEFFQFFQAHRQGTPLVMVTGDHGEEYLDHGRIGHATDVSEEQIHVPFVLLDQGLESGRQTAPTGHVDVLPTIFERLGVSHPPEEYCVGTVMTNAPADRFILTTVGWEPKYALIGQDLKIRFYGQDIGFGGLQITDSSDRPLLDAEAKAKFAGELPNLMRSLKNNQRK